MSAASAAARSVVSWMPLSQRMSPAAKAGRTPACGPRQRGVRRRCSEAQVEQCPRNLAAEPIPSMAEWRSCSVGLPADEDVGPEATRRLKDAELGSDPVGEGAILEIDGPPAAVA